MKHDTIPKVLESIVNLSEFSRTSGIARSTLEHIKANGIAKANVATLTRIAEAIERHKPKRRRRSADELQTR